MNEMPLQFSGATGGDRPESLVDAYDPREELTPKRLTLAMWDQAFLMRHAPGESFEDWSRVLAETEERGYNTVRLDPMPQWVDLKQPDRELYFPDPQMPYMPWCWNREVRAPIGRWLIEYMEKMLTESKLYYTLSPWWFGRQPGQTQVGPDWLSNPSNHVEAAEMWAVMLRDWERLFGFDRLVYVDLANEVPYFFPGFMDRLREEHGLDWGRATRFSEEQIAILMAELNPALALLRDAFPQLRFTISTHADVRWLDVPLELDCMDVHFYSDADQRWRTRTRFGKQGMRRFTHTDFHADFSKRCRQTADAIAPMLRQRQRAKLAKFAAWSAEYGAPLTTSESWASWFYNDSPDLDWGWLLDWAAWSVEDALDYRMWGWTPHNYLQPQFANWQDVAWHRRLTDRFLNG